MKRLFLGAVLLALIIAAPVPTMAGVDVNVSIGLPPLIVFSSPPEMIVLPDTYVYVVPDVDAEIFFYNGWWWRPWEGRWYRSHYYDRGWGYYQSVPSFYVMIPSGWRNDYRDHRWKGHQWNYQRLPHHQVKQNWKGWEKSKHWEKQQSWGVQDLRSREDRPKSRESVKPQTREDRPKSRESVEPQTREDKPKSRESVKPQTREDRPKSRESVEPRTREDKPKSRESVKPQTREDKPKSREDKPKRSKQQQGNPEKGDGEKQDR